MSYIETRNPEVGEDLVLETLRTARANIEAAETGSFYLRERIVATERWHFDDWKACTCGHIYLAADDGAVKLDNGDLFDKVTHPVNTDGVYEEALKAIARANADHVDRGNESYLRQLNNGSDVLHYAVSDATTQLANELHPERMEGYDPEEDSLEDFEHELRRRPTYDDEQRVAALALIDKTIAAIEATHEQARRQVAGEEAT